MVDGGALPDAIEAARLVTRYGAASVYGRPLGVREMRRINLAENVERVCRVWLKPNAAKWFADHPDDQRLFAWAMKAYKHG